MLFFLLFRVLLIFYATFARLLYAQILIRNDSLGRKTSRHGRREDLADGDEKETSERAMDGERREEERNRDHGTSEMSPL